MFRRASVGFAVLLCVFARPVRAESEAGGRLTLMVRSLVADYHVKRPAAPKAPLAVFDFACPEALAKQRVGYAVAELVKTKLIGAPEFAVLERSELDRILHEQALQQTGVVDANTAVQLGKVVGAALAISGNVDKLGGAYQVSARLADVATGEILAIAVQEFPARVFEAEAQSYLNLVPEEQAIGLTLGFGGAFGAGYTYLGPVVNTVVVGPNTGTATDALTLRDSKAARLVVGIRYQPHARWLVDASLSPLDWMETVKLQSTMSPTGNPPDQTANRDAIDSASGQMTIAWVKPVGTRFRLLAGAGVTLLHLAKGKSGPGEDHVLYADKRLFLRPHATASFEWRPQRRFGIALSGILWLTSETAVVLDHVRVGSGTAESPIAEFDLPRFGATVSTALYF